MSIDYQNSELEREALAFEVHKKITEFVVSNSTKLETIAQMLGANDFLKITEIGKGQSPVTRLDISGFVKNLKDTNQLHKLKLPGQIEQTHKTILPPDEGEFRSGDGTTSIEKKRVFPRTRFVMEILADLNLDYQAENGTNLPSMMRSFSYIAFTIPEINTLLLVNDEEGNATFIVYNIDDTQENDRDHFVNLTKNQLKDLGPEKVSRIEFDKSEEEWKTKISHFLLNGPKEENKKQNVEQNKNLKKAPEGWLTITGLAKKTGRADGFIKKILQEFYEKHPEWIEIYLDYNNHPREHLHPDLIVEIEKIFSKRERPPINWQNCFGLSKKENISRDFIVNFTNQYRETKPEWFGMFEDKRSGLVQYYHPDLIKLIIEAEKNKEVAPDGWQTSSSLEKIIQRSGQTITSFVNPFRTTNQDWFKFYINRLDGKTREHFHPDLIKNIEAHFQKRNPAPEGWMTAMMLTKKIGRQFKTVSDYINNLIKDNPNWKNKYDDSGGHERDHYHPDLIAKIEQYYANREKAPDGWMTSTALSKKIKRHERDVKTVAYRFKTEHPDWIKPYDDTIGHLRDHFNPELIKKIEEYFTSKNKVSL